MTATDEQLHSRPAVSDNGPIQTPEITLQMEKAGVAALLEELGLYLSASVPGLAPAVREVFRAMAAASVERSLSTELERPTMYELGLLAEEGPYSRFLPVDRLRHHPKGVFGR